MGTGHSVWLSGFAGRAVDFRAKRVSLAPGLTGEQQGEGEKECGEEKGGERMCRKILERVQRQEGEE
jgi:hypothetical protein